MAKEYLSQNPVELVPIVIENEGEVFNNEYEWNNPMYIDLVCVYVIAEHPAALERAHRIILRDMQSHLKHIHLAPDLVYAEIYALKGFTLSESLCMYHYHLQCTLGAHMQVWVSTKGGMR
jgi:hypothetical protein